MPKIVSSHQMKTFMDSQPQPKRNRFGIHGLDTLTDGYGKGELIVITGYSSHGKTTLCETFTQYMSEQSEKILWFSFEMTYDQFFRKFNKLPKFYVPESREVDSLNAIEDMVRQAKEELDINVVFIDHLHYIINMMPGSGINQSAIIGDVCRRLKQMSLKYDMTIFLVAHTGQPRDDKMPDAASIRDSSFIVQEADAVYAIHRIKERGYRSDNYGKDSWLLILKQRRTGNMGKRVRLTYNNKRFQEAAPAQRPDDFVG